MLKPFELNFIAQENNSKKQFLIGIDEVGRGALFGPVTVAGVIVPFNYEAPEWAAEVADSKKISLAKREELTAKIQSSLTYTIKHISVQIIDKYNINEAIKYGVYRLIQGLCQQVDMSLVEVLIDGNYRFEYPALRMMNEMPNLTAVVGGDDTCFSISCASIIAKVTRDRLIDSVAEKYKSYDLESNKGYGTPKHLKAIESNGLTKLHRRSFTKNYWSN